MQTYTPLSRISYLASPGDQQYPMTEARSLQVPRSPSRIYSHQLGTRWLAHLVLNLQLKRRHAPFLRQSAQFLLSGCLTSSRNVRAWRSVVALSGPLAQSPCPGRMDRHAPLTLPRHACPLAVDLPKESKEAHKTNHTSLNLYLVLMPVEHNAFIPSQAYIG
jgi:hypothetical protein